MNRFCELSTKLCSNRYTNFKKCRKCKLPDENSLQCFGKRESFQETLYINIYLNVEMNLHCYNYADHNINEFLKKDLNNDKNSNFIA